LTRLNNFGVPLIKGSNDLSTVKIIDVVGWAPTKDGLAFAKNSCTGKPFKANIDKVKGFTGSALYKYTSNDIAIEKLLDRTADLVWIYADQASNY